MVEQTGSLMAHALSMRRKEPRFAARPTAAVVVLAVATAALTACSAPSSTDAAFNAWYSRMRTVFNDSNGAGGGGGATPGSVELSTMRAGNWTIYAVCNNASVLHIRIRGGNTTLADSDIPCGATVAIPIKVTTAAAREFQMETSHPRGTADTAWWSAQVDSPSWKQTTTFSFN